MRAVLRRLHSPDVSDLDTFEPSETDNFGFLLQILVGPDGGPGEESFDVFICTPRWLLDNRSDDEIIMGRHMLIMFRYDYARLHRFILAKVNQAIGANWDEVASHLARLGKWEFEDYVPEGSGNP
jgi:hypothetical protein